MLNKLLILFIILTFSLPAGARVVELSSSGQDSAQQAPAEIYKPSKLIIGESTPFVVKGEPGSYIRLLIAADEKGENIFATIDGKIGEKGVTELMLGLPDDKELINEVLYFDLMVWKNEDFSDLQSARIIGIDGTRTTSNDIVIAPKPSSKSLPGVGTSLPGVGDMSRAMDAMKEGADYGEDVYYQNKPLILRNLRTPE